MSKPPRPGEASIKMAIRTCDSIVPIIIGGDEGQLVVPGLTMQTVPDDACTCNSDGIERVPKIKRNVERRTVVLLKNFTAF